MIKSILTLFLFFIVISTNAQPTADELAKKLSNPVASLISVPFQFNFQYNINGPASSQNGYKVLTNFQPVIPITLSKNWNLIGRVIVPVIAQRDVTGYNEEENGLGDILATAFFSPAEGSIIWGLGPAFSIPTATNDLLGTKKFAVGPSLVVLGQPGKWTVGGLFNQLWSVAGRSDRPDINSFYFQPFFAYGFTGGFTFGMSSENLYDWKKKMLVSGLVAFNASQIFKIAGSQLAQFQLSPVFYYSNSAVPKPSMGVRTSIIFIFPK